MKRKLWSWLENVCDAADEILTHFLFDSILHDVAFRPPQIANLDVVG